jgi:AMP deaminase
MHAHPSSSMSEQTQHFSTLPPGALSGPLGPLKQARMNQPTTAIEPGSPTSTKGSNNFDRPRRTSSMTINPSVVSAPQPQITTNPQQQQYYQGDGDGLSLTRTTSSVNMDGEPRIFPGVVSRSTRRSSMRSGAVEDGSYVGYRKGGETGSVREEVDTDDEE